MQNHDCDLVSGLFIACNLLHVYITKAIMNSTNTNANAFQNMMSLGVLSNIESKISCNELDDAVTSVTFVVVPASDGASVGDVKRSLVRFVTVSACAVVSFISMVKFTIFCDGTASVSREVLIYI